MSLRVASVATVQGNVYVWRRICRTYRVYRSANSQAWLAGLLLSCFTSQGSWLPGLVVAASVDGGVKQRGCIMDVTATQGLTPSSARLAGLGRVWNAEAETCIPGGHGSTGCQFRASQGRGWLGAPLGHTIGSPGKASWFCICISCGGKGTHSSEAGFPWEPPLVLCFFPASKEYSEFSWSLLC